MWPEIEIYYYYDSMIYLWFTSIFIFVLSVLVFWNVALRSIRIPLYHWNWYWSFIYAFKEICCYNQQKVSEKFHHLSLLSFICHVLLEVKFSVVPCLFLFKLLFIISHPFSSLFWHQFTKTRFAQLLLSPVNIQTILFCTGKSKLPFSDCKYPFPCSFHFP